MNFEAIGWEETEEMWKGSYNEEHIYSQMSKLMKSQMLPLEPLEMLFPTTSNATGICWTETKFEVTCQGPLVMKDTCSQSILF